VAHPARIGTVLGMIRLTRLRQTDSLWLNPDHIERLERHHETVVRLLNGAEYVVVETPEEIVDQVTYLRARSIALAARLAADELETSTSTTLPAAAAVSPLPSVGPADDPDSQATEG
jgi:uncharacterized protein YlzI (FlbEa/FlbD family)